jgi:hypothetical protein
MSDDSEVQREFIRRWRAVWRPRDDLAPEAQETEHAPPPEERTSSEAPREALRTQDNEPQWSDGGADPLTSAERRELNSLQGRIQDGEDIGDYGSERLRELHERDAGYAERLQARIEEELFKTEWTSPPEATRTISLAEHVDELRAELRGGIDSDEREGIAVELNAARAALEAHDRIEQRLYGASNTIDSLAAVAPADEYPDITAHPDPVGLPGRFPDGSMVVHLGDGDWADIDTTPGAFTAVRLWPRHSPGMQDYRLYDNTGTQVAHVDVAIVGNQADVANFEAEGGALGIKALHTLQAKLKEEFPELTAVKGLHSSGVAPGHTQEVEFQHSIQNVGDPQTGVLTSTALYRQDFDSAVAKLSAETGLPYEPTAGGEFVAGTYRQSLTLPSGRLAMIDNGLGFALVPWTPELDQRLGRHVSGVAQESGGIEWSFGRKRGIEI